MKNMYPTKSVAKFFSLAMLAALIFAAANFTGYAAGNSKRRNFKSADLWQIVDGNENGPASKGRRLIVPDKYSVFRVDRSRLDDVLRSAPLEFSDASLKEEIIFELPTPDGKMERFRLEESPMLAANVAAQFPTWKTFSGQGIDDPTAMARFDTNANGFHGYVSGSRGTYLVNPYSEFDRDNYVVYYKSDLKHDEGFSCRVDGGKSSEPDLEDSLSSIRVPEFANGTNLRTLRLAVAATKEYTNFYNGNVTTAFAAITTSVNRMILIYRRELAVTFTLVSNTSTVYTTANNGGFPDASDAKVADLSLPRNQVVLDAAYGDANYDIGHAVSRTGNPNGLAASPSICSTGNKAQGFTGAQVPQGDGYDVDYLAHEIGHQFGMSHTFNNSVDGSCTTRSDDSSFEPASGVTIMGYGGICAPRNLSANSIEFFHARSIEQSLGELATNAPSPGGTCGTTLNINNVAPAVNAGGNFTIPKLTPFTLTGSATDATNNGLTYAWEEYDLGAATASTGAPDTDAGGVRPIFRSYNPSASSSRTFPSLTYILNNANTPPATYTTMLPNAPTSGSTNGYNCAANETCITGESLPSIARTMNFRLTVRDNFAAGGGVADATAQVTVVNTTGPFQVTAQNVAPTAWAGNSTQTVTWDVAGTNVAPINAANVKISLSTDGGLSFPTVLLASTPNDGTEPVTVPNTATAAARIKVEAIGNIFFDINNINFAITAAPTVAIGDVSGTESGPKPRESKSASPSSPANTTFDFVVTRSGDLSSVSTIHYTTVDGTATVADHDYEPTSGTLTFGVGVATKIISVIIDSDDNVEPDESFTVHLDTPNTAVITDADGQGNILNDDVAPTTFAGFGSATYKDDESQSAVITLTRTGDLTGASSVTVSTVAGGTAIGGAACGSGADYASISQTVNFAAGASTPTQPVTVQLCRDQFFEGNETINLLLSNPASGSGLATQSTAILTINDTANQYLNTTPINMTLGNPASPYPSTITVANAPSNVFRVRVTLYDVTQSFPDNMKVLLVGPNGAKFILMADAGGPLPLNSPVTLTFTDGAGQVLPDSNPLTTGKFEPTSWGPVGDFLPSAPAGPYVLPGSAVGGLAATTLYGNFGQVSGNGNWDLYVRDDNGGLRPVGVESPSVATGSIAGGWGLELLAPTAAGVEVSGRVTGSDGRGLSNARVIITDSIGVERAVTTNSFGLYRFEDVEAGGTYVIGVSSKRYRFASRVIQTADSLTSVDFVGQQ